MAITVTMESYVFDRFGPNSVTWSNDIREGERQAHGPDIILPEGIMRPGESAVAGTLNKLFCSTSASGVGGYLLLTLGGLLFTTINDITAVLPGTSPPEEDDLEEFTTSSITMQGKTSNGSTENLQVKAKKSGGSENVYVVVNVYHRTAGGTETQIGTDKLGPLTTSFVVYTGSATITQAWVTSERIVVKFVARNEGIPP